MFYLLFYNYCSWCFQIFLAILTRICKTIPVTIPSTDSFPHCCAFCLHCLGCIPCSSYCHIPLRQITHYDQFSSFLSLKHYYLPPHIYLFPHISVMLSPESPSKWQMRDSLSSTPCLLYNESDQTEDELEVFSSESEAAGVVPDPKSSSMANGSSQNSKSPLTFVNQRSGRAENGQTGCSSASPAYTGQTSTSSERIPTEGDLRFARKVSLKISSSYLKSIVLQVGFSQVVFYEHFTLNSVFCCFTFKRRPVQLWNSHRSWACSCAHRSHLLSCQI